MNNLQNKQIRCNNLSEAVKQEQHLQQLNTLSPASLLHFVLLFKPQPSTQQSVKQAENFHEGKRGVTLRQH